MCDDGERVTETIELIGRSFLATLNELDRAKQLTKDSPIQDLGLVMSLYLYWGDGLGEYGVDEGDVNWREQVLTYAKQAEIDLVATGCYGIEEKLETLDDEDDEEMPRRKADRWDWKKSVRLYPDYQTTYH